MPLKKSLDMLADLGMTGRVGMDTVHEQIPIGPVRGCPEILLGKEVDLFDS
jgi:hypothetical protein